MRIPDRPFASSRVFSLEPTSAVFLNHVSVFSIPVELLISTSLDKFAKL